MGIAAAIGVVAALLGALVPGPLRAAIGAVPLLAVLRDGQQYVAPLAVVVAVGVGVIVDLVARVDGVGRVPAALGVAVPLVLLPGLAWGAAGRLEAVGYPADWARAREIIDRDPAPGAVLVLPWATYRRYAWNGGRAVLDPLPRYFGRETIISGALVIGGAGEVPTEDPRARALTRALRSKDLTRALAAKGIRYVVLDEPDPAFVGRLTGCASLLSSPDIDVLRIPASGLA
jgi:hypothetical protein